MSERATKLPATKHMQESVWAARPKEVTGGRPVGLLWLSPDCKHFSRAKGAKPVEKRIRSLAWVAVWWARDVRPRVIMLENVREFQDWGPLEKRELAVGSGQWGMMPDPAKKGRTFAQFVGRLQGLGYRVEWRVLNAAEFGAPTHRRRLFMIARRDGLPIVWPERTHGVSQVLHKAGKRDGSHGADSSRPRQVGVLRERGMDVVSADGVRHLDGGAEGGARVDGGIHGASLRPFRTAAECIDWSLPCPSIFERKKPLAEKTLRRIAMGIKRYVLENPHPFIVKINHGGDHFRGQSTEKPPSTITHHHGHAVVSPSIMRIERSPAEFTGHAADVPLSTITAQPKGGKHAIVAGTLVQTGYGERDGQAPRALDIDAPLGTVVAGGAKVAQVSAFLAKHYGGVVGHGVERPLGTVTAVDHHSVVAASLTKFRGESKGSAADEPVPTITSGAGSKRPAGAAHALGMVAAHLTQFRGSNRGKGDLNEPMPTTCADTVHVGEVRAFLLKYYGTAIGAAADDASPTLTSKHRLGLVMVAGVEYQIADIGLRMLTPRELARAQGFPEEYVLTGSKSSQVARIGNSVCPVMSETLVRANCVEPLARGVVAA